MIEINLLPWRMQLLAQQKKWRHRWWMIIACSLVLFAAENSALIYFQQKMSLLAKNENAAHTSIQAAEESWVALTEQMNDKLNHFLTICQKISASEVYHVQLIKMQYTDRKIAIVGNVNSITDLSNWIKALNANGFHPFLQRLSKSGRTSQFNFSVSIQ